MLMLTHSSMQTFLACPRKYQFRYRDGLRRVVSSAAQRKGSALHAGLDTLALTGDLSAAITRVSEFFAVLPPGVTEYDFAMERETIIALLVGYFCHWGSEGIGVGIRVIASELPFHLEIRPGVSTDGVHDKILQLPDGRLAIGEHKTVSPSTDLSPGADYWQHKRIDSQVSHYVIAARSLGFDVKTVLYDVIRKPKFEPQAIALRDEFGYKIVLDSNGNRVMTKDGKKPRETGSTVDGFVVQTRPETCEEYRARIVADIREKSDWYFVRHEVTRLESDLVQHIGEMEEIARGIESGTSCRNTGACRHFGGCEYAPICFGGGWKPGDAVPNGFEVVTDKHPELRRVADAAGSEDEGIEYLQETA